MNFDSVKKNLENNGFDVTCFDNKIDACEYMSNCIKGHTIGFGGSITLDEMGLYEKLSESNEIFWHWKNLSNIDKNELFLKASQADIYITSANAIAESGEIINIDGAGNRVSASLFGHKKIYIIIGRNKLEENYDKALWRARNISAPLNAQRLQRKTPCAKNADKCYDCNSIERICNALVVLWKKPYACQYEVILIDEILGY